MKIWTFLEYDRQPLELAVLRSPLHSSYFLNPSQSYCPDFLMVWEIVSPSHHKLILQPPNHNCAIFYVIVASWGGSCRKWMYCSECIVWLEPGTGKRISSSMQVMVHSFYSMAIPCLLGMTNSRAIWLPPYYFKVKMPLALHLTVVEQIRNNPWW